MEGLTLLNFTKIDAFLLKKGIIKDMAKPFVKWVGGKTQLLECIRKKYPKNIAKYCEPFLGGGAVLFDVLQTFNLDEVIVNDINSQLMNAYFVVKNNVEDLIEILRKLQNDYYFADTNKKKDLFYSYRDEFNNYINKGQDGLNVKSAALFICLNKTCFNGMYRVNSKGLFNVPFNNAVNPLICDEGNLRECSKLLKIVELKTGDYSDCLNFIDEKTFVYIDPPYRPLTSTSSFTSYSVNMFDDNSQIQLGNFVKDISKKGAYVVISNSDPKNINQNDNFFDDIYSGLKIERVKASRMINCKPDGRAKLNELLISNYG